MSSDKIIFLSHAHEERELAILLKSIILDEFSGFVDVFVSSDGQSIPTGSNFLEQIENGLVDCVAALYLISPMSVKRPWISFELGAVWIRNVISQRNQSPKIPVIPICHSGMTFGDLPPPINNINSVLAGNPDQLRSVLSRIQTAVGGKGELRTNFHELSLKVRQLEEKYSIGRAAADVISILNVDAKSLLRELPKNFEDEGWINIDLGPASNDSIKDAKKEALKAKSVMQVEVLDGNPVVNPETGENGVKRACLKITAKALKAAVQSM